MKALRRSMKGEKDAKPAHVSLSQKTDISAPPKKVIAATRNYTHGIDQCPSPPPVPGANFLDFSQGDYLYVAGDIRDGDQWYDAWRNEGGNVQRGFVPIEYFKDVGKTRSSTGSQPSMINTNIPHDSGYSTATGHTRTPSGVNPKTPRHVRNSSIARGAMVYGVVQYDFHAERPDELDAKAGEAIIVIAQSNPEWFVAKPIGRLGGPGLIPVAFIEIKDMATGQAVPDPHKAVQAAGVPKVEEWKKMAAEYKNSSISLGQFTIPTPSAASSMAQGMQQMSLGDSQRQFNGSQYDQGGFAQQPFGNPSYAPQPPQQRQLLAPVSASIPRYCFENDKYWYIIECVMEDGSHWELSRFYQNFYDFQIKLLQQFPAEAAADGGTRILPYMPGPVTYVTDAISNGRRESLDEYVKRLLRLPHYIGRCQLVRELFDPKEGDFELDPKAMQEDYRLSIGSQQYDSLQNSQSLSREPSNNQMDDNPYAAQARSNPWEGPPDPYQYSGYENQSPPSHPNSGYGNLNDSSTYLGGPAAQPTMLKVKVWFEDDCVAIRVASDIRFEDLREKVVTRLGIHGSIQISYDDERTGEQQVMDDQDSMEAALQNNRRLNLYVGFK